MKILQVVAEVFHADERTNGLTDMTKLITSFSNFANAPINPNSQCYIVKKSLFVLRSPQNT